MKVVHGLARHGFIETVRGRGGGIRLARPAAEITVGAVIRAVEDDFALVECFRTDNTCRITPVCRLRGALQQALGAYFEVLDNWTLAELVAKPKALLNELHRPALRAAPQASTFSGWGENSSTFPGRPFCASASAGRLFFRYDVGPFRRVFSV